MVFRQWGNRLAGQTIAKFNMKFQESSQKSTFKPVWSNQQDINMSTAECN